MRRTSSAFFLAAAFLFGAPAQAGFQEGFDAFRNSDYSAAMAELLPAAERGDAGAAIPVGILYANGYGLDGPDFDQAKHWFETAAVAGPTPVMVVKGALMGMRRKADQEFAAALAHFGADAAAGEPGAQYLMAWISNNGVGTATDEIAGLAYLRDAASGGYAQAKFQLAELMLDGLGVPRDETGAAQMFGEAAESGHAASQNALALLYVTGRGALPKISLNPPNGRSNRGAKETPTLNFSSAVCIGMAWVWTKMTLRPSIGPSSPQIKTLAPPSCGWRPITRTGLGWKRTFTRRIFGGHWGR